MNLKALGVQPQFTAYSAGFHTAQHKALHQPTAKADTVQFGDSRRKFLGDTVTFSLASLFPTGLFADRKTANLKRPSEKVVPSSTSPKDQVPYIHQTMSEIISILYNATYYDDPTPLKTYLSQSLEKHFNPSLEHKKTGSVSILPSYNTNNVVITTTYDLKAIATQYYSSSASNPSLKITTTYSLPDLASNTPGTPSINAYTMTLDYLNSDSVKQQISINTTADNQTISLTHNSKDTKNPENNLESRINYNFGVPNASADNARKKLWDAINSTRGEYTTLKIAPKAQ